MNKGIIKRIFDGTYVIECDEDLSNGYLIEHHEIHPQFKNYNWIENEEVKYVFATECSMHYPLSCNCSMRRVFAYPIIKKKQSIFKKIITSLFKKTKKEK